MILAIRHFPDRKRPCLVLEDGNKGIVLGYLLDERKEKILNKAFSCKLFQIPTVHVPLSIDGLIKEFGKGGEGE